MPGGILQKGYNVLESEGLAAFLLRSSRFILARLFSVTTYNIYQIELSRKIEEVKSKSEDCFLVVVESKKQVDQLIADGYIFPIDPEFGMYDTGFDSGASLFLVFVGHNLAHSSWVADSHKKAVYDALFSSLDFGAAGYIGPCNTFENFRGLGIYPYVLTNIFQNLMDKGIKRALISTRNDNNASIRGITKAGFIPLCTAKKIKILGHQFFVRGGSFG